MTQQSLQVHLSYSEPCHDFYLQQRTASSSHVDIASLAKQRDADTSTSSAENNVASANTYSYGGDGDISTDQSSIDEEFIDAPPEKPTTTPMMFRIQHRLHRSVLIALSKGSTSI